MDKDINIFSGSKRLEKISFSPIRKMMDKVKQMQNHGLDVVSFSAGEPNFDTPKAIKNATIEAINNNFTHYGSNRGLLKLRKKISEKISNEIGIGYDPETEIIVTSSGAEAINNAIISVVDPGDEVIIFTPGFISYESVVNLCNGIVVDIPLTMENNFQINIEDVKKKITNKTKLIIINNPCNPTGVIYTKETLSELSKLACENNLLVFSDEIYSNLTYDNIEYYSIASFPGMRERTIVMNGFSKTYAMTGWRVGYLLSDARLINNITKVHQYSTTCGTTFIEEGLANSMDLESTKEEVSYMISKFGERRQLFLDGLDKIKKLSYAKADGAFYIFVNVSKTGLTGEEFSNRLLDEKYVATVPGVGLGKECVDFIRISYATSEENIIEGLKRIEEFVESLSSES